MMISPRHYLLTRRIHSATKKPFCLQLQSAFVVQLRRSVTFNTNSTSNNEFRLYTPSSFSSSDHQPTTSWERGAARIKNPKQTTTTHHEQQYMETIRATHDPSLPIKTLEQELLSTMGQALGKQGAKIVHAVQRMEHTRQEYERLVVEQRQKGLPASQESIRECAKRYNEFRKQAITARWELLVHRQAVGFIVNNHSLVMEKFPIDDALPVDDDDDDG